jgi:hypothetical protein
MKISLPKIGLLSWLMIISTVSNVVIAYSVVQVVFFDRDVWVKANVYGTTDVRIDTSSGRAIPVEIKR